MSQATQRIALITGANRGLGLETSRQLAAHDVLVIMAGRDERAIYDAAKTLKDEGLTVRPVVMDVVNDDQIEAVRALIEAEYGRLDILINNAGIISGEVLFGNSSQSVTKEALRQTFEVNLFAPIALTQALLPLIERAEAGRIVNLSSIMGSLTVHSDFEGPLAGAKPLAYDASKAALNMFTVNLAAALRDTPIKVNAAHPGWVKTELGSQAAPMELVDGAKTSVELALLGPDGPTGAFIHLGEQLPW